MWWTTDEYKGTELVPGAFSGFMGPKGIAIVRAGSDGKTDPGWGEDKFMKYYEAGKFVTSKILTNSRYMNRPPFAFVMRSMKLVCIDIDGKNGGLQEVGKLGMLPYTLAEISKSGNGYHLFYATSEDTWDTALGFAEFKDRIGIQQGVDFRATGCVFHWPSQKWNDRPVAELPQHLKDMLKSNYARAEAMVATITKTLENGDPDEILLLRDSLISDLGKPIPAGRRNNTLFAIGSQLMLAAVPDWENLVRSRAIAVKLDTDEVDKLIRNIDKYGANA